MGLTEDLLTKSREAVSMHIGKSDCWATHVDVDFVDRLLVNILPWRVGYVSRVAVGLGRQV